MSERVIWWTLEGKWAIPLCPNSSGRWVGISNEQMTAITRYIVISLATKCIHIVKSKSSMVLYFLKMTNAFQFLLSLGCLENVDWRINKLRSKLSLISDINNLMLIRFSMVAKEFCLFSNPSPSRLKNSSALYIVKNPNSFMSQFQVLSW